MSQVMPAPLADFLARSDALAGRLGIKRSTMSLRIFDDGKTLGQIAEGRDVGVRRLEVATRVLSAMEADASELAA